MEYEYIIHAERDVDDGWMYDIWRRPKGKTDFLTFWPFDGGWMEDHGNNFDSAIREIELLHDIKAEDVYAVIGA